MSCSCIDQCHRTKASRTFSTVYLSMIAIASDTYRAREFCHDFSSGIFLGLFCSRAYSTRHTVTSRKSSVEKRTKLIRSARSSLCNVRLCVCVRMGEAGRAFSHACSAWPCEQCQHCKPNVILTTAGAFIEMARLNNCWHLHYAFSIHILQMVLLHIFPSLDVCCAIVRIQHASDTFCRRVIYRAMSVI